MLRLLLMLFSLITQFPTCLGAGILETDSSVVMRILPLHTRLTVLIPLQKLYQINSVARLLKANYWSLPILFPMSPSSSLILFRLIMMDRMMFGNCSLLINIIRKQRLISLTGG